MAWGGRCHRCCQKTVADPGFRGCHARFGPLRAGGAASHAHSARPVYWSSTCHDDRIPMSLPPRPEDDPRPEPPIRPDDDACCGSGCDPCIFDFYAEALNSWRAELAAWEAREAARREAAAREAGDATAGDTTPKVLTRCEPPAKRAPKQAATQGATPAPKHAPKQAATQAATQDAKQAPKHAPTHAPKQAATQTPKRAPKQPRKPAN